MSEEFSAKSRSTIQENKWLYRTTDKPAVPLCALCLDWHGFNFCIHSVYFKLVNNSTDWQPNIFVYLGDYLMDLSTTSWHMGIHTVCSTTILTGSNQLPFATSFLWPQSLQTLVLQGEMQITSYQKGGCGDGSGWGIREQGRRLWIFQIQSCAKLRPLFTAIISHSCRQAWSSPQKPAEPIPAHFLRAIKHNLFKKLKVQDKCSTE